MLNNTKKQKTHKTGFTIVETLVAISILLVSTTGPLTFAQSGLRASFLARDQITAFYLAQDVIETIKNRRDNKGLDGGSGGWLSSLGACAPDNVGGTTMCNMDTGQGGVIHTIGCSGPSCPPLYYDENTIDFLIDNGNNLPTSKYTRTIYITQIVADKEAQIVVEIKWESNFFSEKRIVVQENIYNWVPQFFSN